MSNHRSKDYIEVEDTVEAYIEFKNANACFYATNAYVMDAPVILELSGDKGMIRIEGQELIVRCNDGDFERYSWSDEPALGKHYWGNSHRECIADFYRCLDLGIGYMNDLGSTKDTFDLVMDIYEVAKEQSCHIG